jgi:hypothetical protein
MASYAVALLRDVRMGPDIVEYLDRIDLTLAAFDGHFRSRPMRHGLYELRERAQRGRHSDVAYAP